MIIFNFYKIFPKILQEMFLNIIKYYYFPV